MSIPYLVNKYAIITLFGWVLIGGSVSVFGQDPVLSSYITQPEMLNPAFVGGRGGANVYSAYRLQFPSLPARYESIAAGVAWFVNDLRSGFGLNMLFDDSGEGLYTTLQIKGQYAYHVDLGENHYLSIGVNIGYGRNQIDVNRFIFPDQLDPIFGPVTPGGLPNPTDEIAPAADVQDYLDIGSGLLYYQERFFVGAAFHHLNNPANDFFITNDGSSVDGLPMRWTLHGGLTLPIVTEGRANVLTLYPQVMYTRQRDFGQLNLTALMRYKQVDFGLGARLSGETTDAAVFSAGYSTGQLRFYYAHDLTLSGLSGRSGGAHELGIAYRLNNKEKRVVECFDFY